MISLIDYAGYILLKGLSLVVRLIPLSAGLWCGRRLGLIVYFINRKRARIAFRNLKAAGMCGGDPGQIKNIVNGVYQNLMQTLVEVLAFPRIDEAYVKKYITFEGIEHLEAAKERGKGIIFLTGHFGNWELFSVVGGIIGYSMLVLAREQKHSRLNDLINSYRELTGSTVIKKGFAIKEMLTALHDNRIIGMLVDQDAGRQGVFVDFFGRKTSFAHGPMSFALRTDATIIPTFIVRRHGPYHRIVIEKPIAIAKSGNKDADTQHGLQAFAAILESHIREHPSQWLWVHKRWKSTPTRKILVLSDGKAGHLNQSLAVAEVVQQYRKDAHYAPNDTQYEIAEVRFKNAMLRRACSIGAVFANGFCQGCMTCLKRCLEPAAYNRLMATYADVVISCGSSIAGVNVLAAKASGAKNIIIMKPLPGMLRNYNLVIAPRHDRLPQKPNIVITEGAPNRITDAVLQRDGALLTETLHHGRPNRIGVLIGGDNAAFHLSVNRTKEVINALIQVAGAIDAELLVTTSRRTPPAVEQVLKDQLTNHSRCPLLIIANERNMPEAVGGILALSSIVVVSSESISMISEAVQSSKYVFVFELEKKGRAGSKHDKFLANLADGNYIKLVPTDRLRRTMIEVWESKPPLKRLEDRQRIYEAVKQIA